MFGATFAFGALLIFIAAMGFLLLKLYQANPAFLGRLMNYMLLAFLAIGLSAVAVLIGMRTEQRGNSRYSQNLNEVRQIWGGSITQAPPAISYQQLSSIERHHWQTGKPYEVKKLVRKDIKIWQADIKAKIDRDIRKKGLQVYNGYRLNFTGTYRIKNLLGKKKEIFFHLPLPTGGNNINDAVIKVNGRGYHGDLRVADGLDWSGVLDPGKTRTITVTYRCQGLNNFRYTLNKEVREIPKFALSIDTDFPEKVINYMGNSMVHSAAGEKGAAQTSSGRRTILLHASPLPFHLTAGKRHMKL